MRTTAESRGLSWLAVPCAAKWMSEKSAGFASAYASGVARVPMRRTLSPERELRANPLDLLTGILQAGKILLAGAQGVADQQQTRLRRAGGVIGAQEEAERWRHRHGHIPQPVVRAAGLDGQGFEIDIEQRPVRDNHDMRSRRHKLLDRLDERVKSSRPALAPDSGSPKPSMKRR